jgi:hypothetical protein
MRCMRLGHGLEGTYEGRYAQQIKDVGGHRRELTFGGDEKHGEMIIGV